MSEGKLDAATFARSLQEKIDRAEGGKVTVTPGEFKLVDLDPERSYDKWTVIGGAPTLPLDFEVASNTYPEVPMIAIQGNDLDSNLFAMKGKHQGVQLKALSHAQGVEIEVLDNEGNLLSHAAFDPTLRNEQRHDLSIDANTRAMLYLGPGRYPMRIFQREEEDGRKVVRMVFNPPISKE